MLRSAKPAAAAALICSVLALGCGGSDAGDTASGSGPRIGVALRLADCDDWNQADVAERIGTVEQLRDFAGGPTGSPGNRGVTLTDERGYEVMQNWCRNDFARGFKLYKLYTRAAAFSSLVPTEG
jgi:hypothetical protein